MQDILSELARAPLWAQVGLSLFVAIFLYSVVGSHLDSRRYRSRFSALAGEFGQDVEPSRGWPVTFSTSVSSRTFEIRYDYKVSSRNYRGPLGHLLVSATRLAAPRWELHQVDINRRDGVLKLVGTTLSTTGDRDFDARFLVREDGIRVREGWLDAPTRAAVVQFYESPAAQGPIWIHEQQVMHQVRAPWNGIDGTALRSLLDRQAALATSLERTAG